MGSVDITINADQINLYFQNIIREHRGFPPGNNVQCSFHTQKRELPSASPFQPRTCDL